MCEKATRTTTEWNNVNAAVKKLQSKQRSHIDEIRTLKDEIESNEATSADVFVSTIKMIDKMWILLFFFQSNVVLHVTRFIIL